MNKSLLQKKFRFVMIIAALALFITIVTPAYFRSSGVPKSNPGVIMMWTILFGVGEKSINAAFNFSWIAFISYLSAIILLIICLIRKFVTVEAEDKNKKGSVTLDAICMILSLISLVMFILLPITLPKASVSMRGEYLVESYAWGISYILAYIFLAVMFLSSLIVLYAEVIVKFKTVIDKKENKKEVKEVKEPKASKKVKETKTEEVKAEEPKAEETKVEEKSEEVKEEELNKEDNE